MNSAVSSLAFDAIRVHNEGDKGVCNWVLQRSSVEIFTISFYSTLIWFPLLTSKTK